jgi:hypothetical protein
MTLPSPSRLRTTPEGRARATPQAQRKGDPRLASEGRGSIAAARAPRESACRSRWPCGPPPDLRVGPLTRPFTRQVNTNALITGLLPASVVRDQHQSPVHDRDSIPPAKSRAAGQVIGEASRLRHRKWRRASTWRGNRPVACDRVERRLARQPPRRRSGVGRMSSAARAGPTVPKGTSALGAGSSFSEATGGGGSGRRREEPPAI